jgi:hypothetical protein
MSATIKCDGCGKEVQMTFSKANPSAGWLKPHHWYQRMDSDGPQDACSRECIEKIAKATGKTPLVLPI